ncbi:MAG: hypothetical protein P1U44_10720 [Vicingaceae bacterium]|nr:hypothetical protein [Vicingaceae bacterium]
MSGFKLLAIRPLEGCDEKFRKNLKEGVVYKFYQNYRFYDKDEKEISTYNNNLQKPIVKIESPNSEIDLYSSDDLKINVSAIVGMNGSGKSTLLELLFLANYIIAIKSKILESNQKLEDIQDQFKIELYYKLDQNLFCVLIDSGNVEQRIIAGEKHVIRNYRIKKILQDEKFEFEDFFYSIVINYSLYSLNSTFLGDWVKSLFHKNDGYQTPIVINPYREEGNINVNREIYLSKQRLISNLLKPVKSVKDNHRQLTDLQKVEYILFSVNDTKIKYAYKKWIEGKEVKYSFDKLCYGFRFGGDGKELIPETKEDFINKVIKAFLGEEFEITLKQSIKHSNKVEKYIIKKLVQIARTYSKYHGFFSDEKKKVSDLKPGTTISNFIEFPPHCFYEINSYLNLLVKDNSHITFKLRQAINYLKINPFRLYELEKMELPQGKIDAYHIPISDFSDLIMPHAKTQQNVIRFVPPSLFDIELEFHPIKGEISSSYYSMLSSGEQQLIQSVQSILYHINNLESVFEDNSNTNEDKKTYHFVNIVLDEIELYFHPEFQRKFVNHLIRGVKALGTSRIKKFNILFATHSPFILSDIPSVNILRLEDGSPQSNDEQTFGANIHQLLHNDFFLKNGFIGEFAKEKINEIVDFLQMKKLLIDQEELTKQKQNSTEEEMTQIDTRLKIIELEKSLISVDNHNLSQVDCKNVIKLIGEPLLFESLNNLYQEVYSEIIEHS